MVDFILGPARKNCEAIGSSSILFLHLQPKGISPNCAKARKVLSNFPSPPVIGAFFSPLCAQ
jgi:hypothetical protein